MPIYFSWFITALLSVSGDLQQSQPTAKWAPFILRVIEIFHQPRCGMVRNTHQRVRDARSGESFGNPGAVPSLNDLSLGHGDVDRSERPRSIRPCDSGIHSY